MNFPLSFEDLSLWLAVTAIILLATSQLISPSGKAKTLVNKKRLRNVAFVVSTLFLLAMIIRIYGAITLT
jgi:Ni,Fe-hydrogenase I cytochrome b subunit